MVKPSLFWIASFFLLAVCCRAQTVPPLTLYTDSIAPCQGRTITFRAVEEPQLGNFEWQVLPKNGFTTSALNGAALQVTFLQAMTYTVSLTAFDSVPRQGRMIITISRTATASFNASLSTQGFPNELLLSNYSENSKGLRWYFSDGSVDSLDFVKHVYSTSGVQNVQLVAFGQNGCNDTTSYEFYIHDSSGITLPNVFTPNLDGVNDVYRPIARGILHLNARVYSRDRIMLYSWETINGSWDGYTTSGLPCTDGVYFVVVEAVGFDNKKYSLSSYIQLLR